MATKTKNYIDNQSQKDFYKLITDGKYDEIGVKLVSIANDYSKDNANFLTLKSYLNRKKNSITVKENIPLTNLLNNIISNLDNVVKKNRGNKDFNATINDFKIDKNNRDEYNKYLKTTKPSPSPTPTTTTKPPTTTTKPPTTTTKPPTTTTTTEAPSQETIKKFDNRLDELRDDINNAKDRNDYQTITDELNLLRKFAKDNKLDDDKLKDFSAVMNQNIEAFKKFEEAKNPPETGPQTEEEAQPEVGPKTKSLTEKQKKKYEEAYDIIKKARESKSTVADDNEAVKHIEENFKTKSGLKSFIQYTNERNNLKPRQVGYIKKTGSLAQLITNIKSHGFKTELETVSTLPKKVTPKAVPEEELLSPAERIAKARKELNELKSTLGTSTPTEEQQSQINKLEGLIKELTPEAEKKKKEEQERTTKTSEATVRQGDYRPHFKNVTKGAVDEQLSKSAEEQIRDVKNWFIFDIPDSFTGQGTALDNPIIRQNDARDELLYSGNLYQDFIQAYNGIVEGVDGRKDFYKQNNVLTSQGVKDGLTEIYYEETEDQFLQRFNKGTNALFSQDQTPFEKNDFQNIYQTPARFHKGGYTQPQFINNNGIVHNNDLWINNPNYFYKGAVVN